MLPVEWTAIASRPREITRRGALLTWTPLPDAPMGIAEAHQLAAAGMILIANKHFQDAVEMVIRPTSAVRTIHKSG